MAVALGTARVTRPQRWDTTTLAWVDETLVPRTLVASAPVAVSVGLTSETVLSSNSVRGGLVIVNLAADAVSLAFDAHTAVLHAGITLQPGASWTMTAETFTTGAVQAIGEAADCDLSIQEFTTA